MMKQKLNVLLTNDDGFPAPGIQHLYTELSLYCQVTMVAPESEQSGIGHAFTFQKALTYREKVLEDSSIGYVVTGTPVDCVKIALSHLLTQKPDIILSGINNGANTGLAGYYSGTVAAAREGAFWQIPSIAFSLCEHGAEYYAMYAKIAWKIISKLFERAETLQVNRQVYYNINFPSCHPDSCEGIKITRQSLSFWDDMFVAVDKGNDVVEYWLRGARKDIEAEKTFDTSAIEYNYITITPLHIDATAYDCFDRLLFLEKKDLKEIV